jgi:phosphomannomutase
MSELLLFDVDGTLAKSTKQIAEDLLDLLLKLKSKGYHLAVVGGGNYDKIREQLGDRLLSELSYLFTENGIVSYRDGQKFHERSLDDVIDRDESNQILQKILRYMSTIELPLRTGSFVIKRRGMWYLTPIGSNCTDDERQLFSQYDEETGIREKAIRELSGILEGHRLDLKLGGQIGIGCHPQGWDKSYVIQFLEGANYRRIRFYGDSCSPDGNDFPLFSHPDIQGYWVTDPNHTMKLLGHLL